MAINYDKINEVYDTTCVDVRSILFDLDLERGNLINTGNLMDTYKIRFSDAYKILCVMVECGVIREPDVYQREQFHMVTCTPIKHNTAMTKEIVLSVIA